MKRIFDIKKLLTIVLTVAMLFTLASVQTLAAGTTAVGTMSDVYLDGLFGEDSNSGASQQEAVKSFAKAKELLAKNGVIHVTGTVIVNDSQVWSLPESEYGSAVVKYEQTSLIQIDGGTKAYRDCIAMVGNSADLTLEKIVFEGNPAPAPDVDTTQGYGGSFINQYGGTLKINEGTKFRNNYIVGSFAGVLSVGGTSLKDITKITAVINDMYAENIHTTKARRVVFITNSNSLPIDIKINGLVTKNCSSDSDSADIMWTAKPANTSIEMNPTGNIDVIGIKAGKANLGMAITINPVEGYPITSVEADGTALAPNADGTYTLNVTETFPANSFKVEVSSSGSGSAYGENGFTADDSAYDPDASAYTVSTAAQLKLIADGVNAGDTFAGKTISLANDISLADYAAWTPIGGAATKYNLNISNQTQLDEALEAHFLIYDSTGASYVRGSHKNGEYVSGRTYYYLIGAAFAGTFDGEGYAVSDLTVNTNKGYAGLFGNVNGMIKDLTVNGSVTSTTSGDFVGGISGKLSAGGTIEGCVSNVTVMCSNGYNIGGITGFVGEMGQFVSENNPMATVRNCLNTGNVSGNTRVAGIAGRNAGTVEGCVNTGTIKNLSGRKKGTGGIVGMNGVNNEAEDAGIVINCYNLGTIDCNDGGWSGGIVGFNNGLSSVSYCYNAGPIINRYSFCNPIVGTTEGSVSNCLFLDAYTGSDANGVATASYDGHTGTAVNIQKKTADELKDSASVLFLNGAEGTAWNTDDATNPINDGYPILAWQGGSSSQTGGVLTADNFAEISDGYFAAAGISVVSSADDLSFTVSCDKACVVAIANGDGTYTVLSGDENHVFTAASADDSIIVAVKGDVNKDGAIDSEDYSPLIASFLGNSSIDNLEIVIGDTDGNGMIDSDDFSPLVAAFLGNGNLAW